jgi:hypothetical protein
VGNWLPIKQIAEGWKEASAPSPPDIWQEAADCLNSMRTMPAGNANSCHKHTSSYQQPATAAAQAEA